LTVFTSCVNWFGVRSTTSVSFVSVAAQVVVMILLVVVAALAQAEQHGPGVSALGSAFGTAPLWRDPLPLHGVLAGTSICVMSFLGFDAVSTLAEDTADRSGRTLGRAILAVLGLATLFFVVLSWVLGNAMAGRQFHSLDAASFELAGQLAGPWAMLSLAWFYAIVVGFTNALPMQVGVARVLYAMGRDRQLPQALARLHPKHNTPHVAMLASTAVSLVVALAMRQQVEQLAAFVNFGALAGFTLLHVCVLAHFARHPQRRKVLPHVVSPVLGIAVVVAVLSGMNVHALVLGLVWFCAGLALWWLRVRHTGAAITTPAG
jgi:amino acid transporter